MASSSDIRKLFKAMSDNPDLHNQVRSAKTPAEKHDVIRGAGHVPVTQDELQAELTKTLQSGAPATPEDQAFVGHVMSLAAADSIDHADG